MKEDILEQLVEDWLVSRPGFFVKHNIKYRPSKTHPDYNSRKDSVHSDIDLLAVDMQKNGMERVHIITCKSWQGGFDPEYWIINLEKKAEYNLKSDKYQPKERWKFFRELVSDKWIEAFLNTIEKETGQRDFTYTVAVTITDSDEKKRKRFEETEIIRRRFADKGSSIKIRLLPLSELIQEYFSRIRAKTTPALEATDVGRLLQLLNAAGLGISERDIKHNN